MLYYVYMRPMEVRCNDIYLIFIVCLSAYAWQHCIGVSEWWEEPLLPTPYTHNPALRHTLDWSCQESRSQEAGAQSWHDEVLPFLAPGFLWQVRAGSILPKLRELEFPLHLFHLGLHYYPEEIFTNHFWGPNWGNASCGFSSFLNKLSILIQERKQKQYLKLQRGSLPLSSCGSFAPNYWVE